jgi:hypothetical protein
MGKLSRNYRMLIEIDEVKPCFFLRLQSVLACQFLCIIRVKRSKDDM